MRVQSELVVGDALQAGCAVMRVRNAGRRFGDKTIWIDSLDIPRGSVVAIIGASGSGKSTVLHLLGGLSRPDPAADVERTKSLLEAVFAEDGTFRTFDLRKAPPYGFRQRTGFVFQSPYLLQPATASANIALGAVAARRAIHARRIEELAQSLDIDPRFLSERSNARSGGERQRIALARALARHPNLVLADEPTANLDPALAEETIGLLRAWTSVRLDRTLIWVTHDVHLAARFADYVVIMRNGRLADWMSWPQANPGDAHVLRKWIDGVPFAADAAPSTIRPAPDGPQAIEPEYRLPSVGWRQRVGFWMKVGLSQVFDGPGSDQIAWLRARTSVVPAKMQSADAGSPRTALSHWFTSFNSKAAVLRLSILLTIMVALWAEFDALRQNIRESLLSPTLNPVVVSSRATIDGSAIIATQRLLAISESGTMRYPAVFGRYEFDQRRVSVLREDQLAASGPDACATAANRVNREITFDTAGLEPGEPILEKISLDLKPGAMRPELIDRTDRYWSIWLGTAAKQRAHTILEAPATIRYICMEIGGVWITGEIAALMTEPPRGRFGPYDVIMSGTQWRDFGPVQDRDYYQTASIYFDAEPEHSRKLVDTVRVRASEMFDPPNTRLVQSLTSEAGFERISAALERNRFSNLMVGFLGTTSLVVLVIVVYSFLSESFRSNLKSICVAMALGAGFHEIAVIQLMRIALVAIPTAVISAVTVLIYAAVVTGAAGAAPGEGVAELLRRYGLALSIYLSMLFGLTLAVSAWWLFNIRRRALTDQLKELD